MKIDPNQPLDPRVASAIDTIVDALGLKGAARTMLATYVAGLPGRINKAEKLPCVSFYAAKTRHGGINWRITYRVPGYKKRTERLGKTMRLAYKRAQHVSNLLNHVEARVIPAADAYRELYINNAHVSDHAKAFINAIKANGVNPKYLQHTETRLNRCFDLGDISRLNHIKRDMLPDLVHALYGFVEPKSKKKLTTSTINQYLAILREFTRWATPERMPIDPLANTKSLRNAEKVIRRDVLEDEVAEMVAYAEQAGTVCGMAGPDRAMVYWTAFGTGFRRGELKATEVEWVKLDGEAGVIFLPATVTKTKKSAEQHLPAWLTAKLKVWLGGRTTGRLFPTFPDEVHEAFEADRAGARAAWVAAADDDQARAEREADDFLKRRTVEGVITYHSLRHAFSSTVLSKLDVKTAQMLTRHATAGILTDRYAHSRQSKAATAVETAIPDAPKRRSG